MAHKGSIDSVFRLPTGTEFLRTPMKKVDKSKWCTACGGRGRNLANKKSHSSHAQCTGRRRTISRVWAPCECPCRKGLAILDPNL